MFADWRYTFLYRLEAACMQCLCDHSARISVVPACFSITCQGVSSCGGVASAQKAEWCVAADMRMHS